MNYSQRVVAQAVSKSSMRYIKAVSVQKSYGKNKVLEDFNVTLNSDVVNFLIGDNGTGKSTFIKCLLGFSKYLGNFTGNVEKFSYAPERVQLPGFISVDAFLYMLAELEKDANATKARMQYYLELFALTSAHNTLIKDLSKGMRQKVILIQTLMKEADCYIFDEPLNGLDNDTQVLFVKILAALKKQHKLLIITTHFSKKYPFRKKKIIDFNHKEDYQRNNEISSSPSEVSL